MIARDVTTLGPEEALLRVVTANSPDFAFSFGPQAGCLQPGEVKRLGDECGNGWRKVFNIYAKLVWQCGGDNAANFATWQSYRDNRLLQSPSACSLHFVQLPACNQGALTLLMGKRFAIQSGYADKALWLNPGFAVNSETGVIITPYFDYRQLSDIKITFLISLITSYFPRWTERFCQL